MPRALPLVVLCLLTACTPGRQHSRATTENPLEPVATGFPQDPLEGYKSPQARAGQSNQCAIGIGISGGGSISASFAYGVLEYLSEHGVPATGESATDRAGRFLYEIDYFATASGGGIPAALVLEMLREFAVRSAPGTAFDPRQLQAYFGRSRFRGVLDWGLLGDSAFAGGLIGGGSAGGVRRELEVALSGRADEACRCRDSLEKCRADRPTCRLNPPLSFQELFIPRDDPRVPSLPVWFASTTLFQTGTHVPVTPAMLRMLGITRILFEEGTFGLGQKWVDVDDLDLLHALALSMAFPGIGPVVAETRVKLADSEERARLLLADGGQSDNLGLTLALAAVAQDLRRGESKRGVVLVLDSALESAYAHTWSDAGFGARLGRTIFNSTPLLGYQRRTAPVLARGLTDTVLPDGGDALGVHFLRASEVLDDGVPVQFCDLGDDCLDKNGFPEDRDVCLAGARCGPEQQRLARDRIRHATVTLALKRQQTEDLITLGRRAAEDALRPLADGRPSQLRADLDRCLAP